MEAAAADDDGDAGAAGEQEGFVAEGGGVAGQVDKEGLAGAAAVSAREDADGEAEAMKGLGESEDDGCFAGAPGGEAADAEDDAGEGCGLEAAGVAQELFDREASRVERHQRPEEGSPERATGDHERASAGRSGRSRWTERRAAPVSAWKTACARCPRSRTKESSRRSRPESAGARSAEVWR